MVRFVRTVEPQLHSDDLGVKVEDSVPQNEGENYVVRSDWSRHCCQETIRLVERQETIVTVYSNEDTEESVSLDPHQHSEEYALRVAMATLA